MVITGAAGDLGAAAEYAEQAIRLATASGNKDSLVDALDTAGNVETERRNLSAARDYLERAVAMKDGLEDKSLLIFVYSHRGRLYQELGDQCMYETFFDTCRQHFQLARADFEQERNLADELGFKFLVNVAQGELHTLGLSEGQVEMKERIYNLLTDKLADRFHPKKADDVFIADWFAAPPNTDTLQLYQQALAELTGKTDPHTIMLQGLAQADQGNIDAALDKFLKAADLVEQYQGDLRDEQVRGAFLEDKMDFYYVPILHLLDRHRLAEAFDLMERSRSRAMTDLLASRTLVLGTKQERGLYSELMKLRTNIAVAQRKLFGLPPGADAAAQWETRISKMQGEYQTLQSRIAQEAPRLKQLTDSNRVSLETIQRSAKQDNCDLLYYLVLEASIVIWHIGGDDAQAIHVYLPRPQVMAKVAALHDSLTKPEHEKIPLPPFDEQTSRELYLYLIQPVKNLIKTQHLVIIPHESLNYIPFAVLQDPSDGTYLGEKYQISYAPSGTILASLKKTPNLAVGRLLALANPDIGAAVQETETIGGLYAGRSKVVDRVLARREDVETWVAGYKVVHLSVHGVFRDDDPLLSYLELRRTMQDDGHLTAAEMFGLPLEKDSLVVLSACETGRVKATHGNEILGMERALLYAGANDLVLSSWHVEAKATALWMETFYREAQTKPLSEAARLALRAVKAHPEYRHPFFWGPFLLTGK